MRPRYVRVQAVRLPTNPSGSYDLHRHISHALINSDEKALRAVIEIFTRGMLIDELVGEKRDVNMSVDSPSAVLILTMIR